MQPTRQALAAWRPEHGHVEELSAVHRAIPSIGLDKKGIQTRWCIAVAHIGNADFPIFPNFSLYYTLFLDSNIVISKKNRSCTSEGVGFVLARHRLTELG